MINKVISVCKRKDIETFKITAKKVSQFIEAKKYVVVVPKIDVEAFEALDIGKYSVISEEKYDYIAEYLRSRLGDNQSRFGWYFQQFIKLAELDDGGHKSVNLIWDADTVPLKKIEFKRNEKIYFYQGGEHHKPYFDLIQDLLDLPKISKKSFISQCFPCKSSWIKAFKKHIENKFSGKPWFKAIIDRIDASKASGFSEYETLGTFVLKKFPSEIELGGNRWYRCGNRMIGGISEIDKNLKWLSTKYDYIAFESWDNKSGFLESKIRYFCKRYFDVG